ncbi:MAG TPA: hypothetical protein VF647_18180 [Longimicrobium sp.]|jgi:pimeloyl-ACP methyl ester carboxylesterase
MPKIGVLTIHGMGEQEEDFDSHLRAELDQRFSDEVRSDVVYESIWFSGLIQGRQDQVWEAMRDRQIDMHGLRKFFLYYFSDATTYVGRPDPADAVYRKVHHYIRGRLDALREKLGGEDGPTVVIAHSLGCQVISDYIWDAAKGIGIWHGGAPATEFQRLGTARYLLTCGCNIPLFVSGLPKIVAIERPNPRFRWINFFDRDDVLGWPLKPLSDGFDRSYARTVDEDREINVGGIKGLTPLSHTEYWKSAAFTSPVAKLIEELHAEG